MKPLRTRPADKRGDEDKQDRNAFAFAVVVCADLAVHVIFLALLVLLTREDAFVALHAAGIAVIIAVFFLYRRGVSGEGATMMLLMCEAGILSIAWMAFFGFPALVYCHVLCFIFPGQLIVGRSNKIYRALQITLCGCVAACVVVGLVVSPLAGEGNTSIFAAVTLVALCALRTADVLLNKRYVTRNIARYEKNIAGVRDESMRDPLTGLWNRRYLDYNYEKYEFMSSSAPCAVAMLDLDMFKNVNDRYSHMVGDQLLLHFSSFLKGNLRASDHIVRWGGEEFLIIFTNTGVEQAFAVLSNLREDVKSSPMLAGDMSIPITFTAGLCELRDGVTMQDAVETSDALMYSGKIAGRDRVVAN